VRPMIRGPTHLGLLSLPLLFVEFLDGLNLFLQFHPTVLEPNFDLPFRQAERVGHFNTSSSRQVMVRVKFFLQL